MSWSTSGTASSWPSWPVPVTKLRGTSTLVLRVNPDNGMCFLAGAITVPAQSLGTTFTVSDSPAPALFRPRSVFVLDPDSSGATTALDASGNLIGNYNGRAATYTGGSWRTFFFTDTPTP